MFLGTNRYVPAQMDSRFHGNDGNDGKIMICVTSMSNTAMDLSTPTIRTRLQTVRQLLKTHSVAALLVPSSDPHLSEYLPERWQGRQWLSGFTGSMGTLVVTPTQAALFADSRYWVQADTELAGTGISLIKINTGADSHIIDWLIQNLPPNQTVAVDANVLSLAAARRYQNGLREHPLQLRGDLDIFKTAWPQRPGLPNTAVYEHTRPQATQSRTEKFQQVRQAMQQAGATHHLLSTVDDIAWMLNLRGSDVEYNPVFLAHALLDATQCTLFVATGKIPPALQTTLLADGVVIKDYDEATNAMRQLPAQAVLLVDVNRITFGLHQHLAPHIKTIEAINPSTLLKSQKTAAQAEQIRETMRQDGAAMCEFYAWFEAAQARQERITELTIDEQLSAARARRPGFVGLSFPTIAGFNANGAMPHYRATSESHAVIDGHGLLLIDSGGQYLGGTTDITRVWPIGQVSAAQKRDYTLVLKGTLALSRTRFPTGTLSPMLDAIARAPLWQHGLDYGHGTGHGVGYFLNVHEGPQSISKGIPQPHMAMQLGMVTSIEPGLYRPDQWGIRIENLVLNVQAKLAESDDFLEFETLTLCPIDTRCIDLTLLNVDEVKWLNTYHATVREQLLPLVHGDARVWLQTRTAPI
jgi:Xaa-Pro aminopeptidase